MNDDSKFHAQTLRKLIRSCKTAEEIMDILDISRTMLKVYLYKLIKTDKKYYEICGLNHSSVDENDDFWVTCDSNGILSILQK